jgi:hypothetical protein
MKQLAIVLVLVVAGIAAVGFYRGWFTASTGDTGHGGNVTIGVNQDKIREDEAKVKENVHGLGGKATDAAAGQPAPARQP